MHLVGQVAARMHFSVGHKLKEEEEEGEGGKKAKRKAKNNNNNKLLRCINWQCYIWSRELQCNPKPNAWRMRIRV